MNGIHDLGGMHGLGPIDRSDENEIFHADWEKRAFSLFTTTAAAGCFNLDEFRHAIENMAPEEYLSTSYYEHWLHSFETCLVRNGFIDADELAARQRDIAAEAES